MKVVVKPGHWRETVGAETKDEVLWSLWFTPDKLGFFGNGLTSIMRLSLWWRHVRGGCGNEPGAKRPIVHSL